MRLVFMGTPESAIPTLRRCLDDGHEVVAVWTQPDRPAGRGNRLHEPPVKQFARERGLAVHQPVKIKTEEARALFTSHDADLGVVVAYGRILPASFLRAPPRGCVNVHFSLLPKYRGAAPVNWAIVRGESETGVTTMMIDEGLDTGAILLQRPTRIGGGETAPELLARLAETGAGLLVETLARLDEIDPRPQREDAATHAPILKREDGLIDWNMSAAEIERRVRGFQPFPGSYTTFRGQRLVVWRAQPAGFVKPSALAGGGAGECHVVASPGPRGEIVAAHGDELIVACGVGDALRLLEVQAEGKRRMGARDFLNGLRARVGEVLG